MGNDALWFYASVVPCAGSVIFFIIVFGTVVLLRWFKHRELLAMVEKGVVPDQYVKAASQAGSGRGLLVTGAVLSAIGLAGGLGLLTVGVGPWLLAGLIPLFIGLALLLVYFLMRKPEAQKTAAPPADAEVAGD